MSLPLQLLLIDDDEVDRQAVSRALRQSPVVCQITQAATATEGLRLAAEQHFDAILLDYRLPDHDGLDVLHILRGGSFEGVAVVMLSRQEDEILAERCLEAGAQDFLLKDEVNGRRLSRAVRQARQRYLIEDALKNSREKLRQLSERDPLTGLSNRRGFEIALEAAVARAPRGDDRLAILLLDLDDFKSINDTLGHDAGDVLLQEIARRLGNTVRDGDHLCRLGGDEFVVLMTNFEHDEQAVLLADRIVLMLQEPIQLGVTEQVITTSIGIATLGTCANNAVDLLKFADVAMYQAKQDGRNQSRFYSSALQEVVQSRAIMKHDLKRALERNEFRVFYQAQISAADGSLGGMEALLRWQHPTLGLLAPAAFLSVAEETGAIVDIGNWVLLEACQQLKEWQQRLPAKCPKLALAVNLSAIQIKQNSLPDTVRNALAKYALEANSLELEITESVLISDTSATVSMLSVIVAQGVTLSLDDFGTGYSSLDHLKLFPISVLKIDRGFVSAVGSQGKSEQLLIAIIAFAKALQLKVVAEGVETKEQAEFCAHHGCDLLQGYYFSRPVPADEFEIAFLAP
ncbi:cyclic di-GMP phosphodiesterase Gmr [mine drainage metagenome]|uniref:Cyclic di-GMP phosphodiesterase Gmr n=1 Tax=mine drainage metagenome TaxID=410659 RepID=A0A1J5RUH3_9ZZZZ